MKSLVGLALMIFMLSANAVEISVKSLSGPPEDFPNKHLPAAMDTRVASNILLLDQRTVAANQQRKNVRSTSNSFSVNTGYGFSLMQVSSSYPDFGPSTMTAPNGAVYSFDGISISCHFGACDLDQADLQMEAFTDRPGGVMVFSISGAEAVSGDWGLLVQDPVGLRTAIQMDTMISYDENFIEVIIDPIGCEDGAIICIDPCPSDVDCIEPFLSLVEGQTPRLSVFASTGINNGNKRTNTIPIDLQKLDISITQSDTHQLVHQESLSAARVASLSLNNEGFNQIHLPVMAAGQYSIRLDVAGEVEGIGFIERTAYYVLPIAEKKYEFTQVVTTEVVDDSRLKINLGLTSFVNEHTHVYAYAEVWSHGGDKPIAWIGGMTYPEVTHRNVVSIPMMLDVRWLAIEGESGGQYTLRNIRIQDADTFVPIAQLSELPMHVQQLPIKASISRAQVIMDDSLYFGKGDITIPAPELEPGSSAVRGGVADSGILLVHGWCSGDGGWPVSQFNDGPTAVFSDENTSRSHDAFARRIRDQGDTFFSNSFSVVAHSQGGAASTHLLAFYNSGLDDSLAPRPIQSIGTPYGGTALMDLYIASGPLGWLVAIISGCEPQFNMTTLGSALWRSGIPDHIRDEVYYYRTRHRRPSNFFQRLQFWRWHCGLTSFAIPRTDDGIVSVVGGRFSRAHDLGITDRECHDKERNGNANQRLNLARNTIMDREGRERPPPPPPPPHASCFVDSIWRPSEGHFEYWVDARNSTQGAFPIANYQWTNNGVVGSPTSSTRFGPLLPIPWQTTLYLINVRVTDTSGAFDDAMCIVFA